MRTFARITILVSVFLAAGPAAWAAPNFSGRWRADFKRSDFGPFAAPREFERTITHDGASIEITTTQGGRKGKVTTVLRYTTDGRECVNMIRGAEARGTAVWEGDALVINSTRYTGAMTLRMRETWTLDAEGRTITIDAAVLDGSGDLKMKLVLVKQ